MATTDNPGADDHEPGDHRAVGTGASTGGSTVHDWVRRLAEPVGDPGGGAASGVMLGMACALTAMVAGYSRHEHPLAAGAIVERADARRERALDLADVDARESAEFGAAYHEPRGEHRDAAVRSAGSAAARISADLAELALEALDDLEALAPLAPAFLRPDVAVAAAALRAALTGARTNLAADLDEVARHGASAAPSLDEGLARFDRALERLTDFDTTS
ncbi:cyclodeaminase/cyclohydrolase family protein [Herbiconiux sp. VKM Ac-2851]|uniref:cyclodeaminase/cyclohydrolase family protein n=1 Tax=Herbiconiux sp. VKM Ac-2851 TaxID=2739025 RepID=UPI00156440EE|nr:cyclodeaminase/cyclohydrolase family protein [Herbiconiux sp. VKM Ac-2851]NQX34653.1 cyclodeaminase/cyclohydrolase family protein [Herbiconiux sp. VKM Ac-2851]